MLTSIVLFLTLHQRPEITVSPQVTAAVTPAQARAAASPGNRALNWAQAHALNDPYAWGAAGPRSYDCSGLVMAAFAHADGITLPHNTVAMVDSGRLHRVWGRPQRGDLAFWGSPAAPYHVEFVTSVRGWSFGAETYGWQGRVTWHSDAYFEPSSYYRAG
jgi:cell wall-associated NlpC family hydrolase